MATAAIDSGARGVTNLNLTRIASILARQTREELDAFVTVAIALMDVTDGDPDVEPNGDELDGNMAEDDHLPYSLGGYGAGCLIAESDFGIDDVAHDPDDDLEREQLPNDVPMLATYDLEGHYVGIGNLQSSFLTNGSAVRSADSGKMLCSTWQTVGRRPGSPI